jgi:endonuclease YncB( thermonuclease family)
MARRGPKGTWQVVLLLVAALVLWLLEQRNDRPAGPPARSGGDEVFSGCRLEDHRQNDGDSFRVRLPDGRIEQFRLYYVDAPESAFRSYGGGRTNHERIREQAADFGISAEQAVTIGQQAKSRVHQLLGRGEFTLHTRWDDPFGDRRYHAFVQPAGGPWLHQTLVEEGLARIHTKPADLPDGTPVKTRLKQLRELENQAKREKRGAWGFVTR